MSERIELDKHAIYPGSVGLQQRILPIYREPFFNALACSCQGGLHVFVGQPLQTEGVTTTAQLDNAQIHMTHNRHIFNPSSPFYLCWQDGLISWLKAWNPDIVIMEANYRYLNTYRAIRYLHRIDKRVIGWGLGAPKMDGILGKFLNWQRKKFLHSFDALIAYSHKGAHEFMEFGYPSKRIFIASNAVAPRPVGESPSRPNAINAPAIVLYVGRLLRRKRVDLLIQACSELPHELQPRIKIVGDGPARSELEALARKIYPQTKFLGTVFGPNLTPIFMTSDLFVLPGTGGLAVQQAMANGLPVIVAQGDGTQDDLVRPMNGWQIPADNLQALKQALREALAHPEKLKQMGEESFRIVKQEINIESMVSVFVDALSTVEQIRDQQEKS